MLVLIVLNIILIVTLLILSLYLFRNKKVSINEDKYCEIESDKHKRKKNIETERIFDGVLITEEEYQQMMKDRRGTISSLMDEVNREYEHFKELNK
jgi:uncharacterized membrane protein